MNPFLPRTCAAIAATVALSTAATVIPQAAHAFSFSVAPAGVTNQTSWNSEPTTVINFSGVSEGSVTDSPPPLATNLENGNANISRVSGDSVYTDNSPLFTGGGQYLSVGTNCTGSNCSGLNLNGGGSVRLSFDAPKGLGYFGLFWASPSINDRITFTLRDAVGALSTAVYNASDIFGTSTEGRYVNFFATNNRNLNSNKVIASVLLEDLNPTPGGLGRSFEVDNIAYQAIPTPALLPGLVALGAGLARKKKAQAEAEA